MSGATYRIDVEHRPDPGENVQWLARIVRLSDNLHIESVWGSSSDEAVARARAWLYAQNRAQTGATLYVNDEGADELPHSVKA